MKKGWAITVIFLVLVAGGVVAWLLLGETAANIQEVKTPHYESNTPANNAVLPLPPPNITIDFNFDLAGDSEILILHDDVDYGSALTMIDDNKLAMRRSMRQDAPDGNYIIKYRACWPDGSCHDGRFSFNIDRTKANEFTDHRSQREITVRMSELKFQPMNLRITKGTKVIWVNDEEAVHYVNTDSHPAHTHVPELNSKALQKGEMYEFNFDETGAYPYHCSAHAGTMTGTILVE